MARLKSSGRKVKGKSTRGKAKASGRAKSVSGKGRGKGRGAKSRSSERGSKVVKSEVERKARKRPVRERGKGPAMRRKGTKGIRRRGIDEVTEREVAHDEVGSAARESTMQGGDSALQTEGHGGGGGVTAAQRQALDALEYGTRYAGRTFKRRGSPEDEPVVKRRRPMPNENMRTDMDRYGGSGV